MNLQAGLELFTSYANVKRYVEYINKYKYAIELNT